MTDPVYFTLSKFLGDTWATVSYLLRESERTERPVKVHRYSGTHDQSNLILRIARSSRHRDGSLIVTDESPSMFPATADVWNSRLLPTKRRWNPDPKVKIIGYQFDGASRPSLQNPPSTDLQRLLGWAPDYQFIKLGKPMTLEAIALTLVQCHMYLGICSGISYLAHSVRVPSVIIEYNTPDVRLHHRAQDECIIVKGTDMAIAASKDYIKGVQISSRDYDHEH